MPTFTSALLPSTTGVSFGADALRWNAYLQNVDISGTLTVGSIVIGSGGLTVVTYSATPVFNALTSTGFEMTMTGNVSSSTLTNVTTGNLYKFILIQDGTGSRTFVWPTNVLGAGDPDDRASKISIQMFIARANGNLYPVTMMSVT